ncbi:MAG: hypothetical protein Q9162_003816 [Coniocarpon cinnabarinum]
MSTKPLRQAESKAFHHDQTLTGQPLTLTERQRFLEPYLPAVREPLSEQQSQSSGLFSIRRPHLRPLLTQLVYLLAFHLIQLVFTVYIYTRWTYHNLVSYVYSILYYHHRSPELIQRDVRNVSRLPEHLSIVVDLQSEDTSEPAEGLEKLMADVSEVAAWCACAGIKMLSVYERTGILKLHMSALNELCRRTMRSYYPPENAPGLSLRAPLQQFSPGGSRSPSPIPSAYMNGHNEKESQLELLLLSMGDGRDTLVDLTKTLAEMAQKGKLAPSDITPELIDAEVAESSFAEPDLLVIMAPSPTSSLIPHRKRRRRMAKPTERLVNGAIAPTAKFEESGLRSLNGGGGEICLRGYPPWQVRLTEIFYVRDGRGIDYQTFLKALHRYAKAEFRFGR